MECEREGNACKDAIVLRFLCPPDERKNPDLLWPAVRRLRPKICLETIIYYSNTRAHWCLHVR